MFTHSLRPTLVVLAFITLATIAIFSVVAYSNSDRLMAQGDDEPPPAQTETTTEAPPVPRTKPPIALEAETPLPPLNSTLPNPGEVVSVETSWGTLGTQRAALEPSPDVSFGGRFSGFTREHKGQTRLVWDTDEYDEVKPAERSIVSYKIERQYFFPDDRGPSEYQVIAEAHPHEDDVVKQRFLDTDVASRTNFQYRVTPLLDDGNTLDPEHAYVESSTSRALEGFGVANGIELHWRYDSKKPVDNKTARVHWLRLYSNGGVEYSPTRVVHEVTPPTPLMQYTYTDATEDRDYVFYYQVRNTATETSESNSYITYVHSSDAPPSAPRNVQAIGTIGEDVSITWGRPATNGFQVAQYEVLRRQVLPSPRSEFVVIATTKRHSYTDQTTEAGKQYDYVIRSITKQGTRGPSSAFSRLPDAPVLTCDTSYGTDQVVTKLVADYDVFNPDGVVADLGALDIWAYAGSQQDGGLERCRAVDNSEIIIQRETYYAHTINEACPAISCDEVDVPAGSGEVEVVRENLGWIRAGWHRAGYERVYIGDILNHPGVYKMRYQVCVPSGSQDLCSGWRDSGTVNWLVPGPGFSSEGPFPIPPLWPPNVLRDFFGN